VRVYFRCGGEERGGGGGGEGGGGGGGGGTAVNATKKSVLDSMVDCNSVQLGSREITL